MKIITLKATGEQKYFHPYFAPFILEASEELPAMINKGYNSFIFTEDINFVPGNKIPIQQAEKVSERLLKEQSQIQIIGKDGSTKSGYFYRTTFNGTITETFDFS